VPQYAANRPARVSWRLVFTYTLQQWFRNDLLRWIWVSYVLYQSLLLPIYVTWMYQFLMTGHYHAAYYGNLSGSNNTCTSSSFWNDSETLSCIPMTTELEDQFLRHGYGTPVLEIPPMEISVTAASFVLTLAYCLLWILFTVLPVYIFFLSGLDSLFGIAADRIVMLCWPTREMMPELIRSEWVAGVVIIGLIFVAPAVSKKWRILRESDTSAKRVQPSQINSSCLDPSRIDAEIVRQNSNVGKGQLGQVLHGTYVSQKTNDSFSSSKSKIGTGVGNHGAEGPCCECAHEGAGRNGCGLGVFSIEQAHDIDNRIVRGMRPTDLGLPPDVAHTTTSATSGVDKETQLGDAERLDNAFPLVNPPLGDERGGYELFTQERLLGTHGPQVLEVPGAWFVILAVIAFCLVALVLLPKLIGSMVLSGAFHVSMAAVSEPAESFSSTKAALVSAARSAAISFATACGNVFETIEMESRQFDAIFRLPCLVAIGFGYLSIALIPVLLRFLRAGCRNLISQCRGATNSETAALETATKGRSATAEGTLRSDEAHSNSADDDASKVDGLVEATLVVKFQLFRWVTEVGLPLVLGLSLDLSTLDVFGSSLSSRLQFAGADLFSFCYLHWVVGHYFAKIVVVSRWELREVLHPSILSQVVCPRFSESESIHSVMNAPMLRQAISLGRLTFLYFVVMSLVVILPTKLIVWANWHMVLPLRPLIFGPVLFRQLQTPLEIVLFHVCVEFSLVASMASIGRGLHYWLKFWSVHLGIDDILLPKQVGRFRKIGRRLVFDSKGNIDQFWLKLCSSNCPEAVSLIRENINRCHGIASKEDPGCTQYDGQRVLSNSHDYIQFPADLNENFPAQEYRLLKTSQGPFRLKRQGGGPGCRMEFWEECRGPAILRPPTNRHPLNVGMPGVDGRWAFQGEAPSIIEAGVAQRHLFLPQRSRESVLVATKLLALFLASWLAVVLLLWILVMAPLTVGRSLYQLLRVPEGWIHDPLAYYMGYVVCLHVVRLVEGPIVLLALDRNHAAVTKHGARLSRSQRFLRMHLPAAGQALRLLATGTLMAAVVPIMIGILYEVMLLRPSYWFAQATSQFSALLGEPSWSSAVWRVWPIQMSARVTWEAWSAGGILLIAWCRCCYVQILCHPLTAIAGRLTDAFDMTQNVRYTGKAGGLRPDLSANKDSSVEPSEDDSRLGCKATEMKKSEPSNPLRWQGRHGRIGKCWETCKVIGSSTDWENVNSELESCAYPITKELALQILVCALTIGLCGVATVLLGRGRYHVATKIPVCRIARAMLASTITVRVAGMWRTEISSVLVAWAEALHRRARDEPYVIGQVLLSHGEDGEGTENAPGSS
jgi:hypothetical protein